MWIERGRADRAEEELRKALALDPDDGQLHYLLAACLVDLDRAKEALEAIESAIAAAPDAPAVHALKAHVLCDLDKPRKALTSAEMAVTLDPDDPDCWAAMAQCHLGTSSWKKAAEAASRGLAIDPDHEECLNFRAFANTQRGDSAGAAADLKSALHHDPDNPQTHGNLGWAALRSARTKDARRHFRDALRLAPGWEPARIGLIHALKADHLLLRPIFWVLLQFTRIPTGIAFGILIASVFARRWLAQMAESHPEQAWIFWTLFWGILGLILFTLLVDPLLNLVLLLHPDGRYALDRRQKLHGAVVGVFVGLCLLCAALGSVSPIFGEAAWLNGFLAIGWSAALAPENPKLRTWLSVAAGALTLLMFWVLWHRFAYLEDIEALLGTLPVPEGGWDLESAQRARDSNPELDSLWERNEANNRLGPLVMYGSVALTWLSSGGSIARRAVDRS